MSKSGKKSNGKSTSEAILIELIHFDSLIYGSRKNAYFTRAVRGLSG